MNDHMSNARRHDFHTHSEECTWKLQVSLCENAILQQTGGW